MVLKSPSLSVAVITTVWPSSGPSLESNSQDQVPLRVPTWLTVPMEAVTETTSSPVPEKVPELAADCPSLTVTVALSAATEGRNVGDYTLARLQRNLLLIDGYSGCAGYGR